MVHRDAPYACSVGAKSLSFDGNTTSYGNATLDTGEWLALTLWFLAPRKIRYEVSEAKSAKLNVKRSGAHPPYTCFNSENSDSDNEFIFMTTP